MLTYGANLWKGMRRSKEGKSFAGYLFRYVLQPEHIVKRSSCSGGNMLSGSVLELISEFNDFQNSFGQMFPKPVLAQLASLTWWWIIIDDQWVTIADDYMKGWGSVILIFVAMCFLDDGANISTVLSQTRIDMLGGKLYLGREWEPYRY